MSPRNSYYFTSSGLLPLQAKKHFTTQLYFNLKVSGSVAPYKHPHTARGEHAGSARGTRRPGKRALRPRTAPPTQKVPSGPRRTRRGCRAGVPAAGCVPPTRRGRRETRGGRARHSRGRPAHQGVLPALPGVKLHLPLLGVVHARLHVVASRDKDPDPPRLDVLFGHPGQSRDVLQRDEQTRFQRPARTPAFCVPAPPLRFTCELSFVQSSLVYCTAPLFYNKKPLLLFAKCILGWGEMLGCSGKGFMKMFRQFLKSLLVREPMVNRLSLHEQVQLGSTEKMQRDIKSIRIFKM